jgi:Mn-dependent DtxR family transcriptional regulator
MMISDFKADILSLVTSHPALDDEQIARILGVTPFNASALLRELESAGLIKKVEGYVRVQSDEP